MSVSFCLFLSNFSEMAPFYGAEDLRDDSLWSADGSGQNLFDPIRFPIYIKKKSQLIFLNTSISIYYMPT